FGSLFERQNLGPVRGRISIGRPGRNEFSSKSQPSARVINLAAASYLGLADDPRVHRAATSALERYGSGMAGPRLLSGTAPIHYELELELATFLKMQSAI